MGVLLRDFMGKLGTMTGGAKSDQPTGDQRLVLEAEERASGYLRQWLEVREFRAALRGHGEYTPITVREKSVR